MDYEVYRQLVETHRDELGRELGLLGPLDLVPLNPLMLVPRPLSLLVLDLVPVSHQTL